MRGQEFYTKASRTTQVLRKTFLKERGMLGPYTTSVTPYCYYYNPLIILMYPCSAHIVTIVPHRSPLLLLLCPYIIIIMSALIILSYIERRSFLLYHPRIDHLCNAKEISPSKRLISKVFIYLFYFFVSRFYNSLHLSSSSYKAFSVGTVYSPET